MKKLPAIIILMFLINCLNSHGIMTGRGEEGAGYPWTGTSRHVLDQEVKDKYPPDGMFLLNLGPTGIRAKITQEEPTQLLVMFVFQDAKSPAKGIVNINDIIVGANGKMFKTPHIFGRGGAAYGYDGPCMDLAAAMEDSQGKDGKLQLAILQGGQKSGQKTVTIQLEPVGRYSDTYPWSCPRSEKMKQKLIDFVISDYRGTGERQGNLGRANSANHAALAMMAANEKRADDFIKEWAQVTGGRASTRNTLYNLVESGGGGCWAAGLAGIAIAEYYRLFKDQTRIEEMKKSADFYVEAMEPASGSFSHHPFAGIQQRIAEGGGSGYGPMAMPGGLSMLAMSLFKALGMPYSEDVYQQQHQCYLRGAKSSKVSISYGFPTLDQGPGFAVIILEDGTKAKSPKGCGYYAQTGMKDIGPYKVVYPSADPQWTDGHVGLWNAEKKAAAAAGKTPHWWLKEEADRNKVYDITATTVPYRYGTSPHARYIVRDFNSRKLPEPASPYPIATEEADSNGATAVGAVAHIVGNKGNKSWEYLGKHAANTTMNAYKKTFDGHGSGQLHAFWVIVSSMYAEPDKQRRLFDYIKTWLVLSETHNGGLIEQPWVRDRPGANTDNWYSPRMLPTTTALMLMSLPEKRLLILGAESGTAASSGYSSSSASTSTKQAAPTAPAPVPVAEVRKARTLNPEKLKALNSALQKTLVQLSDAGQFKEPVPMRLSITQATVALVSANADGEIELLAGNGSKAKTAWGKFSKNDYAAFAQLVARIKPDSSDALAMAGAYLESVGNVKDADDLYTKAGEESRKKFDKLFN